MIVYAITNRVSGRRYIGITATSLRRRWDSHTKAMRDGVKTALYDAMRSYGPDAFEIEQIASLRPDLGRPELCVLERDMIVQEGTRVPYGYNLTAGGDGGPVKLTAAQKLTRLKNLRSPASRAKTAAKLRGRPLSEETKASMRASWTPERHAAAAARKGEKRSAEFRAKTAVRMRANPLPHEYFVNLGKASAERRKRAAEERRIA